jgi:stearoyl-CoA desaturase (delta-9 desaturase)
VVHNASHRNLPAWINTIAGEVLGAVVATRFASWEILHRRHHQYFEDREKDPHPTESSFFRFLLNSMVLNLEKNLHQQYYERFGDTPATRLRERVRSLFSFATMLVLMAFWHALLGPVLFFMVYLPASIFGMLVVAHFNWVTHGHDSAPLNLDHGPYRFLNVLLFGMYLHRNHHRDPSWFNPAHAGDE